MAGRGLALLLLSAAACAGSSGSDGIEAGGTPQYEATVTNEGTITVLTDAADPDDLRAIFDEVRDQHRDHGDEWWVNINCASVPSTPPGEPGSGGSVTDPRLATGHFANTDVGLARTGLGSTDEVEFEVTGRTCSAD